MEELSLDAADSGQVHLDGLLYTYRTAPFAFTNSLGFVRATLRQYAVTGPAGENYFLYKTNDGSWYDIDDTNQEADTALLRALKTALELEEKDRL